MSEKFQYFNGLKFTRDEKTGYYLNSTIRKRLHRYVWEYYNGEIPKGYQVHHKDHDKSNNNIENLELMTTRNHQTLHGKEHVKERYEEMKKNLIDNAIPASKEWHKSEKGHKWHKQHYENMKDKLFVEKTFKCHECGKEFTSTKYEAKFCCNACKSRWRRKQGYDNETRICEYCGKEFTTNKYSKVRTCSRSCANKNRKSEKNNS
jgi:uncharacterized CHY-type Zn-finger protein